MEWIGQGWDLIILNPVVNILIMLTGYLFDNFGLAIILLTVVVNILMYPLTKRQIDSQKKMQAIQSEVAEIRKKYSKDKQKAAEEQMRLMKESGISTTGCMIPMLVQMPVFIALYQSVIRLLATAPEGFLNLSQRLYYSWPDVFAAVPLNSHFLWLDLAYPDIILAVLVGASMWVQQKMTTPASDDPQQKAQAQMMQWMMPLMFGFICISFPSGLALYWLASTLIRIILQYIIAGEGSLSFSLSSITGRQSTGNKTQGKTRQKKSLNESDISADIVIEPSSAREEGSEYGESGSNRQDSGGSNSTSLRATRRKPKPGRSQRNKRR